MVRSISPCKSITSLFHRYWHHDCFINNVLLKSLGGDRYRSIATGGAVGIGADMPFKVCVRHGRGFGGVLLLSGVSHRAAILGTGTPAKAFTFWGLSIMPLSLSSAESYCPTMLSIKPFLL